MSDLTDHQRKAGCTKTEKKTAASRATIAEARKAKELRARYVAALEDVLNMFPEDMAPAKGIAFVASACDTVNRARALRAEIGGKQ